MTRRIALGLLAGLGGATYVLVLRGNLTLDVGVGRRLRPLGPLTWTIAAPRDVVYEVIAAPYLGRAPRALAEKMRVIERGDSMVLAEHYTPVGPTRTTTLETVRFDAPDSVHFRLVRGPVPHVVERFRLDEIDSGTALGYTGELGTDLWALGGLWGAAVAWRWEAAVRESLDAVKVEAERRARARA